MYCWSIKRVSATLSDLKNSSVCPHIHKSLDSTWDIEIESVHTINLLEPGAPAFQIALKRTIHAVISHSSQPGCVSMAPRLRHTRGAAPACLLVSMVLLLFCLHFTNRVHGAFSELRSSAGRGAEKKPKSSPRRSPTPQGKEKEAAAPSAPEEATKFKLSELLNPLGTVDREGEGDRKSSSYEAEPGSTFVMMEDGQMMADWEELMLLEGAKPLRDYMDCLSLSQPAPRASTLAGGRAGAEETSLKYGPMSGPAYIITDDAPAGRVTLDVSCL